ncbi:hypothetical protein C1646_710442 [Rhizophagus diaphanus]|nr:hypothetical protein C1646_710442 [Rhizophagus diaphanus] [Rhizophagus sp. MUCL 43196]
MDMMTVIGRVLVILLVKYVLFLFPAHHIHEKSFLEFSVIIGNLAIRNMLRILNDILKILRN